MAGIYQLTLGSHLQANSFEAFARKRYLPALHAGHSPPGERRSVRLLRRSREVDSDPLDLDRQFLLLFEGADLPLEHLPRVDDPTVQTVLDVFAPQVVRMGSFQTIVALADEES